MRIRSSTDLLRLPPMVEEERVRLPRGAGLRKIFPGPLILPGTKVCTSLLLSFLPVFFTLTLWGLRGRKSPSVRWGMDSPLTETFFTSLKEISVPPDLEKKEGLSLWNVGETPGDENALR